MAINEIVLVANGNGHGHVIVRLGHGLLRIEGKKRDTDTNLIRLKTPMIAVSEQTKTRPLRRGMKVTIQKTLQEHKGI